MAPSILPVVTCEKAVEIPTASNSHVKPSVFITTPFERTKRANPARSIGLCYGVVSRGVNSKADKSFLWNLEINIPGVEFTFPRWGILQVAVTELAARRC